MVVREIFGIGILRCATALFRDGNTNMAFSFALIQKTRSDQSLRPVNHCLIIFSGFMYRMQNTIPVINK